MIFSSDKLEATGAAGGAALAAGALRLLEAAIHAIREIAQKQYFINIRPKLLFAGRIVA
jgi:hypothetical protein